MVSRSWRFFGKIQKSLDFRTANTQYDRKTVHPEGRTTKKLKKFFSLRFHSFGSYPKQFGMSKHHKICNGEKIVFSLIFLYFFMTLGAFLM